MNTLTFSKKQKSNRLADLFTLLFGSLLPLAFAPFNYFFIAFISPTALLLFIANCNPTRAAWRGWLFGIGFFGVGASWVYVSLNMFGQANGALAGLLTILMIFVLGGFIALQTFMFALFFPRNNLSKFIIAFPCLWVVFEWVRTWLLSGFPWLFLGTSQLSTPLSSVAPIAGVYGVSFLTTITCGMLGFIIFNIGKRFCPYHSNSNDSKNFLKIIGGIATVLILWFGAYQLLNISWTTSNQKHIAVNLVQGNIPQELKWNPNQATQSLEVYKKLTQENFEPNQLIIWPESGITFLNTQIPDVLSEYSKWLNNHHSTLITGIPILKDDQYYNGVIALGNGSGEYLKRHLVPFGEYMPFRSILLWLKNYIEIPMSDFESGPAQQPLISANGVPVALFICYEVAYPSLALTTLPEAQLLITISDDSWFGKSIAAPQHLQIAQMRALEAGRFMLVATNDGITAIINPFGKIVAKAPQYQTAVLKNSVYAMVGSTPWVRIGMYPVLLSLLILLIFSLFLQRGRCFNKALKTSNYFTNR